ncbi:MAG: discoidin domain-containing protein [Rudaea sp.]
MRAGLLLLALLSTAAFATPSGRVLDDFHNPALWRLQHSDDVKANVSGADGPALRLDFDFTGARGNPINGYATAYRALTLDLPENFEFSFRVRGDAPMNNLQFKLIDASGDNVWWLNMPDFAMPKDWREIRIKKRQIKFAWGPAQDHTLRHIAGIEFVVSSGRDGGKGSVYFEQLALRALPPPDTSALRPRLDASSALAGFPAAAAMDGDMATAWRSDPAKGNRPFVRIDLGRQDEFSGVTLHWRHGERAASVAIRQSVDDKTWHRCGGLSARSGDTDFIDLCDAQARYLRLDLRAGRSRIVGLAEIDIHGPDWAETRNAFFQHVAKDSPRGTYPRGFVEQPYWTIVGVDASGAPALMSEDGALEPRKGGWSIEPFLVVDGRSLSWADVTSTQSLADGYLPMPEVVWHAGKIELSVDAFARGTRASSQLVSQYRVRNLGDALVDATLELAIRPFQVDPPAQFLGLPGGVGEIQSLRWQGDSVRVDDTALRLSKPADGFEPLSVDGSSVSATMKSVVASTHDAFGMASGALLYRLHLAAHAQEQVALVAPITGALPELGKVDAAWVRRERVAVATAWRERLNRVAVTVPPEGRRIADALRTAHADILLSRNGPALQPGTRSYARSWIRDGAMMADSLLRLGDIDTVREYVDWYAPHQFSDGKVPCCVDHRGSDPVPENDSHGELIHAIAQLYRYDSDRVGLEKRWPHVESAIAYMDQLRASETGSTNRAFKGMMPASISHEGYSAKPMHSYWDDFWALTGYKDAAFLAQTLGKSDAVRIEKSRDEFRGDLLASVALAMQAHAIDFVPGCAELGDFDPTSSTVVLYPAGELAALQAPLRSEYEQYWKQFEQRVSGRLDWKDYTPYEWRVVGSFVRLGWRARAQVATDFFFSTGARPPGWNQWAEVVGRNPREIRFIGDMPHGWVASDFIRSALDRFSYERAADHALVLAAGIPARWFDGTGIAIDRLDTPYGRLGFAAKRSGDRLTLHIDAGAKPSGGFAFPWPLPSQPGAARINGVRTNWQNGELRIPSGPADVSIEVKPAEGEGGEHAH